MYYDSIHSPQIMTLIEDVWNQQTSLIESDIAKLEAQLKEQKEGIDKEWIFEIIDKTNAFAKQLIEDHFKRHQP